MTTPGPTDARLRVGFLLLRDFTLLPYAGFVDVLRLAADEGDRSRQIASRWTTMTADGRPVRASCGTRVTPDAGLMPPRGFDYIVVVGGLIHQGPVQDPVVHAWLREAAAVGVPLVGLCTAVFTLIDAGLASAERGDFVTAEEARRRIEAHMEKALAARAKAEADVPE